jgi:hypothetical protein
MAFITAAQVASYSGLAEASITTAQIDSAEALVAAYIGTETLEETSHTDTVYPGNNSRYLSLLHGPVASIDNVTSVTIGSDAVTMSSVYMEGYWMLFYPTGTFTTGSKTVTVYKSGWDSDDLSSLPTNLQKALLMTCASLAQVPIQGFESEKIGDYSYTKGDGGWSIIESAIPAAAQVLLASFRRPDYLY